MSPNNILSFLKDTFLSINWKDLFKSPRFYLILFFISQVAGCIFILFDYDSLSVKFLPRTVSMFFILTVVFGLLYLLSILILRKKLFFLPASIALFLTNILVYKTLYEDFTVIEVHSFLNQVMLYTVFQLRFIKVSLEDSNLMWGIIVAGYLGLGMLIYGNWFITSKKGYENRYEKQVMYLGGGLYLFLFPVIFIFTHFTFVGSNYQYMENQLMYTNAAINIYEKQNKTTGFEIDKVQWFPNISEAYKYYKAPQFLESASSADEKLDFYKNFIIALEKIEANGFQDKEKIKYDHIEHFSDWIQVAYNFNFNGEIQDKKISWRTDIAYVFSNNTINDQDLLRHAIYYIKEANDGSIYVMYDLSRVFKDHKINYIFNLFFVLYHFIYWGLFAYLIRLHNNKHMKGKKLT